MKKSDLKSSVIPLSAFIILAFGAFFLNSIKIKNEPETAKVTRDNSETIATPETATEIPTISPVETAIPSTQSALPHFSVNSPGGEDDGISREGPDD